MSHGNTDVERGFNMNEELLVEIIQEESLISQRITYDHTKSKNIEPHTTEIAKELLSSEQGWYSTSKIRKQKLKKT